jgi:hypothetical protein
MPGGEAQWWDEDSRGVNLREADLQGARLGRANLQRADLSRANFEDAYLIQANLQRADLSEANFEGAWLIFAKLQGARLGRANLQETNAFAANFQKAFLRGADLQRALLGRANLQGATLWEANFQGANLRDARLERVDLTDCHNLNHIYMEGAYLDRTRLRWEQLGEAIGEERKAQASQARATERANLYTQAKQGYLGLKQNFEDLGDYDAASRAYRKEREMERKEAWYQRRILKWLTDTGQWILTDYGESVWRVFGAIILVFLFFAFLYGFFNGVRLVDSGTLTHDPKDMVLFSLGAMTTLLPPNLQPACDGAQVLVNLETLLAVALTGLLGFVLGNRIRHS